jgi:cytochrome c peroxidase
MFVAALALGAVSCKSPDVRPAGSVVRIETPLGLPEVPIPADNPPTKETIALGRRLFFDNALSRDKNISCASCHHPATGFADRRTVSEGVGGAKGTRNAPTVLNAAFLPVQFWDGRASTLEHQAEGPISNQVEMAHPQPELLDRLNGDAEYVSLFSSAFGRGPITMDHVCKAIASFERTLVSANSPFDRYQYGGEKSAMSEAAIRGFALFKDPTRGNCVTCHTIEEKFALFTDGKFHNLGAGMDENGELRDLGRFEQTKNEADKGAFRTPSLRNVGKTAPYMHDGSLKTLREVVDFYVGGDNWNPHLDKEIHPIHLNRQAREDLIAFLEALTGEMPADVGPPR